MTSGLWARALPPFLLGGALAVAAVVAAGLLLYGGPGFLRALSVLLATLLGALAAGVFAGASRAPAGGGRDMVESLRRRWLLVLVSFSLAAVFSATWEGFRGFGALALTQGLGLSFLGALPLFAGGSLLGTLSGLPGASRPVDRTAPVALAGAAAGALALGFVLFPVFSPTAILLVCLVTLSGAALLQGRALDEVTWAVGAVEAENGAAGVRLERWVRGRPALSALALVEDRRVRALLAENGDPVRSLDRALVEGLPRWAGNGGRALVLGAGGAAVARSLAGREGSWTVVLVEESAALIDALRSAVGNGSDRPPTCIELRNLRIREILAGSPAHLPPGAYDLVFVDTLALAGTPARFHLPDGGLLRIRGALRPGGALIVGPLQDGGGAGSLLDRTRHLNAHFPRVSLYVAGRTSNGESGRVPPDRLEEWHATRPEPGSRAAFLVAALGTGSGWPDRISGYLRVMLEEAGRP